MKNLKILAVTMTLLLFFAVTASADHHAVKVTEKEGIGTYLTDAKGMTLYWFKNDTPNKSECKGRCIEKWPVYYREKVAPPEGISADQFGTIAREDGEKQTTFRGFPLYYWVNDKIAGDTNGHQIKNVWFVINPNAFPTM